MAAPSTFICKGRRARYLLEPGGPKGEEQSELFQRFCKPLQARLTFPATKKRREVTYALHSSLQRRTPSAEARAQLKAAFALAQLLLPLSSTRTPGKTTNPIIVVSLTFFLGSSRNEAHLLLTSLSQIAFSVLFSFPDSYFSFSSPSHTCLNILRLSLTPFSPLWPS